MCGGYYMNDAFAFIKEKGVDCLGIKDKRKCYYD